MNEPKIIYPSLFDCRHLKLKGDGYWQVKYISVEQLKQWIEENKDKPSNTDWSIDVNSFLKFIDL